MKTRPRDARGTTVVEDCIIEQPDFSNAREITLLNNHAWWESQNVMSTVRRNYINGDFTTGTPPQAVEVTEITYSIPSEIMTIKTRWPHHVKVGEAVVIQGSSVSDYNARFTVSAVTLREVTISIGNLPAAPTNAGITVRRYVPEAMPVNSLTVDATGWIATVTTGKAHWRKPGDWVRLSGVKLGGVLDLRYFNGAFKVVGDPAPTAMSFSVQLYESAPAQPDTSSAIWLDRWSSQMIVIEPPEDENGDTPGLDYIANGYALVRTRAPHFKVPGDYIVISGAGDPAWNGYFRVEEPQALPPGVIVTTRLLLIHMDGSPVTVTDPAAYQSAVISHGMQVMTAATSYGARAYGNRLSGLYQGGPYHDLGPGSTVPTRDLTTYNNYYYFCYVGQFSNIADIDTQNDRELWNTTEDNIIDLQPHPPGAWNWAAPGGILLRGPYPYAPAPEEHAMDTAITRDNIIRFADGVAGPGSKNGYNQYGIEVYSVKSWLAEDNLITFPQYDQLYPPPKLLTYGCVENITALNNRALHFVDLAAVQRYVCPA